MLPHLHLVVSRALITYPDLINFCLIKLTSITFVITRLLENSYYYDLFGPLKLTAAKKKYKLKKMYLKNEIK